jgi:hypothetical protein
MARVQRQRRVEVVRFWSEVKYQAPHLEGGMHSTVGVGGFDSAVWNADVAAARTARADALEGDLLRR